MAKETTLYNLDLNFSKNILEQTFVKFDSNYFASVNESNVAEFEALNISCADGLELLIFDTYQQLTVDLELGKVLEIRLTSAPKNINLQTPAILKIPKQLIMNMTKQLTERLATGEWVAANYTEDCEMIYIKLTKSTQFKFN